MSAGLGPVHTNLFSNENGAVLLRFQKDLRPHLSFSYRFRLSTLQRRIRLKTLSYLQCASSNELDAYAFQYIDPRNWRHMLIVCPPFWILTVEWSGARSVYYSIVFSVHTREQRFQKASFSNRSTLESVFEWLRFR